MSKKNEFPGDATPTEIAIPENTARSAPTGSEAQAAPAEVRKSPREWAIELDHGPKKHKYSWDSPGVSRPMGSMAYEVAAVLHGWREHEHHENAPMLITREEFESALKAAMPEMGNPIPHPAALSRHRGGNVRVRFDDLPKGSEP